jgi:hypothetical protein
VRSNPARIFGGSEKTLDVIGVSARMIALLSLNHDEPIPMYVTIAEQALLQVR